MRTLSIAAITLSLALPGCFASLSSSSSQIEQGQAITTGKEPYDAFLEAVRGVREESLSAETEAAGAREEVTKSLGLPGEASAREAVEATRARAAKLKEGGVLLHLEIIPEAKVVKAARRSKIGADDQKLFDALEASVKRSLEVSKKLGELAARVAELRKKRDALASDLETAFSDDRSHRGEMKRELEGADRVLSEAMNLSDKHAGLASKFAIDLALAIETGAGQRRGASRSRSRGRQPGRTRPPAAAAKPPAKPSGGDDFEP